MCKRVCEVRDVAKGVALTVRGTWQFQTACHAAEVVKVP